MRIVVSNPEYISRELAVERSGLALRRLNEAASSGRVRRRRITDPTTRRKQWVYLRADIERLSKTGKELVRASASAQTPPVGLPDCQWLTLSEAEVYTGLPAPYLLRLIEKKQLRARNVHVRSGGKWRVARVVLDRLVERGDVS